MHEHLLLSQYSWIIIGGKIQKKSTGTGWLSEEVDMPGNHVSSHIAYPTSQNPFAVPK